MTDDTMPFRDALLRRGKGDFMKHPADEVLGRLMASECLSEDKANFLSILGLHRWPRSRAIDVDERQSQPL